MLTVLTLTACGTLIPGQEGTRGDGSRAGARAPDEQVSQSRADGSRAASIPRDITSRREDVACLAQLGREGTTFDALPDRYDAPGCNRLASVRLAALTGDRSRIAVSNLGAVRCDLALAFGGWARFGVDRAARQFLGSAVARIETMGSYSCRNVAGSNRRSAHARAAAIDVSGFVLEDRRRIDLERDWNGGTAAERRFLRTVHRSACRRFAVVLGPEYNRAHEDHFHLELGDGSVGRGNDESGGRTASSPNPGADKGFCQ